MISMQLVKHGCALPFQMPQDTLHGIQILVQKGTGLPYVLCPVWHPPEDVLDNLRQQTRLWNFITLYRSGLTQRLAFISVKYSVKFPWQITIIPFVTSHIFLQNGKSHQAVPRSVQTGEGTSRRAKRRVQGISLLLIDWMTKSKLLHFSFHLMRIINSSFLKCSELKLLSHIGLFLQKMGICENTANQKVSTLLLYKH